MLSTLFRSRSRLETARDSLPDGARAYAVGDVHGRLDLLDALLARIDADDAGRGPADTTLIFLGDLVDRGPDSAGVVERLLLLSKSGRSARFLRGNHEEVFLDALDGDEKALRLFSRIGGRETAISYGMDPAEYDALDHEELGGALRRVVPPAHRRFLAGMEDAITMGDYLFVHAGVDPGRDLAEQDPHDLRWIRSTFLRHGLRLGKRVVHGHSIAPEVEMLHNRIGIDTGAYRSGKLTALGLEGAERWTLQT